MSAADQKQPLETFKLRVPEGQFGPGQNNFTNSANLHPTSFQQPPSHNPYLPSRISVMKPPQQAPFYPQQTLPFFKRQRVRNTMLFLPLVGFCVGVGVYAFRTVRRDDFTQDPFYAEVLNELKREEIMVATRHLDRHSASPSSRF